MKLLTTAAAFAAWTYAALASAALSVEIAAEGGPQANAHQKWLQRLTEAGAGAVRIRGATARDQPRVENLGTTDRPLPKLTGVLDRRGVLHLPGARFTLRDAAELSAYLERLEADGPERLTKPIGRFGLTEEEFTEVFEAFTPPLGAVLGRAKPGGLRDVVDAAARVAPLSVDRGAPLGAPPEDLDGVRDLSLGAALAALLRAEGLALIPEKQPGRPVRVRVGESLGEDDTWPIGYDPERSPRETAPALFEFLNVEIDGFTLTEAVDAIAPRLDGLPIVWDRFALRRDAIDPATTRVRLARTRTYYKRVFDRLVIQARLNARLRVDEAGRPFLLIGR